MRGATQSFLPAAALFFGSFLLFGVQPMLGRTLLPSFGGSASVWTVCLAAYQALLLAGYGYAHWLSRRSPAAQRRLHVGLLGAAVLWTLGFAALRLTLRDRLGACPAPSLEVLGCVLAFVGLPYVLLSANSSLLQAWLAGQEGRGVYRLYALSNAGSLLGLLAYPFALEPAVALDAQWTGFAACLLLYTLLVAAVARQTRDARGPAPEAAPAAGDRPHDANLPAPLTRPWLWFALPACSAFLLNAVTAHLASDVTPIPMMWALLLTAFLLSYVIGFSRAGEAGLIVWAGVAVVSLAVTVSVSGMKGGLAFMPNLLAGLATVLFAGTFLHGWLYRIRPGASHVTRYYLGIAAGGAAGGACVSLLAPVLFSQVWEYPLALLAVCAACAWLIRVWDHPELKGLSRFLLGACAVAAYLVLRGTSGEAGDSLGHMRSFYGCLSLRKEEVLTRFGDRLSVYSLRHGQTLHGMQVRDRLLKGKPTTYYGPTGGGLAITAHAHYTNGLPLRVGVIGLGAGTLACYGRTNDLYRFFEINPQVIAAATDTNLFSFISDSAARVECALGDARRQLERESAAGQPPYDVLVVDAYSGDAIPYHLATREAFALYLDRLAPAGVLAVHISNWHIDLAPLCKAVSAAFGLHATGVIAPPKDFLTGSLWVLLAREPLRVAAAGTREIDWAGVRDVSLPTDEKGSILPLIRFGHTPPVKDAEIDFSALY